MIYLANASHYIIERLLIQIFLTIYSVINNISWRPRKQELLASNAMLKAGLKSGKNLFV